MKLLDLKDTKNTAGSFGICLILTAIVPVVALKRPSNSTKFSVGTGILEISKFKKNEIKLFVCAL